MTETFLQFNLASVQFKDSYRQSMEYLTFSQMGGNEDISQVINETNVQRNGKQHEINENVSSMQVSDLPPSPRKRKKRPLDPSISSFSAAEVVSNKKRKVAEDHDDDSDDDVLRGLQGRESELRMNGFDKDKTNDAMETLDGFGALQSQQEREEMQRRKELKERLERNKNDKKRQKKKKKKKLRI